MGGESRPEGSTVMLVGESNSDRDQDAKTRIMGAVAVVLAAAGWRRCG